MKIRFLEIRERKHLEKEDEKFFHTPVSNRGYTPCKYNRYNKLVPLGIIGRRKAIFFDPFNFTDRRRCIKSTNTPDPPLSETAMQRGRIHQPRPQI